MRLILVDDDVARGGFIEPLNTGHDGASWYSGKMSYDQSILALLGIVQWCLTRILPAAIGDGCGDEQQSLPHGTSFPRLQIELAEVQYVHHGEAQSGWYGWAQTASVKQLVQHRSSNTAIVTFVTASATGFTLQLSLR